MDDVVIVKAAHHMDNGVSGADVAQKLVAQALAPGGALYQARDVHKLDDGGGEFLGLVQLGQIVQPLVRHGHHAHIGLDGAEGEVCGRRARVGDGVKQSGFAHVGQSDDT